MAVLEEEDSEMYNSEDDNEAMEVNDVSTEYACIHFYN